MKSTSSLPAFNMMSCIRSLIACSPRQLAGERKAFEFLSSLLEKYGVQYKVQSFRTFIPIMEKAELRCDGKKMEAEACSFVSGNIEGKDVLLSSAMPSRYCHDIANINVNPSCPVIAPGNHYFAPALAVSHETLGKILTAKKIRGSVRVRKTTHVSNNILIGNATSPDTLCFAHYDSIKAGAIDNASGVSVMLSVILGKSELLKTCLFVLAGNEELSYDEPTYWGHGFRALQKERPALFKKAKQIIAVDCVGNGPPQIITDMGTVSRAFPIANAAAFASKTMLLTGDFNQLMTVYHSERDDGRGIKKKYLEETRDVLLREILHS